MLSEEQLQVHRERVTASQVPIILGRSPFETPAGLARKKLGLEREPRSEQLERAARRGHLLEEATAVACLKEAGEGWDPARLERPGDMLDDRLLLAGDTVGPPGELWAATPDFLYPGWPGGEGGVVNIEVKTTSSKRGWGSGGVPTRVRDQVQWQMLVMAACGIDCARTLVCGLVQSNLETRAITFSPSYFSHADMDRLQSFQEHIDAGCIPPWCLEKETSARQYEVSELKTHPMLDDILELQDLDSQMRPLKERYNELRERVSDVAPRDLSSVKLDGATLVRVAAVEARRFDRDGWIARLERELVRLGRGEFVNRHRSEYESQYRKGGYVYVRQS